MLDFLGALVAGIAVAGILVWLITRRTGGQATTGRTALGWASFALGVVTLASAAIAYLAAPRVPSSGVEVPTEGFDIQSLYLVALLTGVAAIVVGALALRRGDRGWPVWGGLAGGVIAAGGWAAVVVYVMFNPY